MEDEEDKLLKGIILFFWGFDLENMEDEEEDE
jgi:hypothetical protein